MADHERTAGWTRTEVKIALISMIISAVGLVASAASSFFAWKQVEMLSEERLTPYRSIIYSTKLDSFKQMTAEWGKWSVNTLPDLRSISYLVSTVDAKGMRRATLGGDDTRGYAELGRDTKQANLDFSTSVATNSVVWPKPIQQKLINVATKIGPMSNCVEYAGQIAEREPRIRGVTWDMFTRRFSILGCRELKMEQRLKEIQAEMQVAHDAMVADLRADQLQSLDGRPLGKSIH